MTKPTLMIFTQPPRAGVSKTRLAEDLGRAEARRIAHFTTARTVRAASGLGWRVQLHIEPPSAADGGFWLFGLSQSLRAPDVFAGVRWSGPHAMEDVWSNLPDHAHVSLLPQLIDIDTGKDWKMFNYQS